jgi:hypothetical protein
MKARSCLLRAATDARSFPKGIIEVQIQARPELPKMSMGATDIGSCPARPQKALRQVLGVLFGAAISQRAGAR